jgi:hypothetical protein
VERINSGDISEMKFELVVSEIEYNYWKKKVGVVGRISALSLSFILLRGQVTFSDQI